MLWTVGAPMLLVEQVGKTCRKDSIEWILIEPLSIEFRK